MKSTFRLFRVFGIDIGVHYTWLLIFVFFSWTLAQLYFPQQYPGWSTLAYWVTGVIASLLIFVSVLLHELAHSLVAKRRGMTVKSITLFILGGVSNLEEEPEKPAIEFTMAIVGPVTSLVLAVIFWGLARVTPNPGTPVGAILSYMSIINLFLGIFNLLPGFPLDGGRVLRSIIWSSTNSLIRATNIATRIGQLFGWALIGVGLFLMISVSFFNGLWVAFIGWFLNSSADASRKEVTMRERLSHIKVKELRNINVETIDPKTTVAEMVENIFSKRHGRAVPVCQEGRLAGIVTITDVKKIPQPRWTETPVEQIMTRDALYAVSPEDNLYTAIKLIAEHDINQVLVKQEEQCAGLLSRADIIHYLQVTRELGISGS
jgi:Zn-dependent protease/CBS domain-containing protein